MGTLLALGILLGAGPLAKDTVIQVRQGDVLVLRDFEGEVQVEGWAAGEVRAEADSDESVAFRFSRSGGRIELSVLDRKDRNRAEDLVLRVPSWLDLDISGPKLDVGVRGMEGEIRIRNLEGDLVLRDLSGRVDASTMEGTIDAFELRGPARLNSGDGDITVVDVDGPLDVESVSGDIEFLRSRASGVQARTMDGDVDFTGSLLPGGDYAFHSHEGEITLTLRPPVDADVTVLAYAGEFESEFPVRARGFRSGHDLAFTIGTGGARLVLEAFDGEVTLLRGGG